MSNLYTGVGYELLDRSWIRVSDEGIPVWGPKIRAQIKAKLIQKNANHLLRYSTQLLLQAHALRITYKNVEL